MLVVDKNTTPIDWLKFELEQQQQHLQAMQAVYADKYVKGKKQRTRGHFTRIRYCNGVQMSNAERILQAEAAMIMGLTLPELLEKFKLD